MHSKIPILGITGQIGQIAESLETVHLHYTLVCDDSGISNQRRDCSNKYLEKINIDFPTYTLTKIILYELYWIYIAKFFQI